MLLRNVVCLAGIAMAVILGTTGPSTAGGASWLAIVERFEKTSGTGAVATLRFVQDGFEGCKTVEVEFSHAPEMIGFRTWSRDLVSAETHAEALDLLQSSHETGTSIRFGVMGQGVEAVDTGPCSYRSRGLSILEEQDGAQGIYSFYKPL